MASEYLEPVAPNATQRALLALMEADALNAFTP